jgi:hypothetical protein
MLDNFIYEMPGMARYRFNHKGECLNIRTRSKLNLTIRKGKRPFYRAYDDQEKEQYLTLAEVQQYIKHLKEVQEFNPLAYHYYVVYRPLIKHSREGKHCKLKQSDHQYKKSA